ncbi:hypothetical protein RYX36_018932, partial [Vicia faba]
MASFSLATKTSSLSVYKAYFKQFGKDFQYFLKLRFKEVALNGMMALTFIDRESHDKIIYVQGIVDMVLNEMGLVEKEKLDMFDFPTYHPTEEKTFKMGWDANLQDDAIDCVVDRKMTWEFIAKYHRAVYEPILIASFGENVMDE